MLAYIITKNKTIIKESRRSMHRTSRFLATISSRNSITAQAGKPAGFHASTPLMSPTHIGKWDPKSKHYSESVTGKIQHEVVVDDAIKNGASHPNSVLTKNPNCHLKDNTVTTVRKFSDKLAKSGKDQPQMLAIKGNSPDITGPDWSDFNSRRLTTAEEHANFEAAQLAEKIRRTNNNKE